MSQIGVALVGFGKAGRYIHAPLIDASSLTLKSIVTSRSDENVFASGRIKCVQNLDDVLADEDVQLVVIATPNHLHFPQAVHSLRSGKSVVIDKPAVLSASQADDLCEEAEKQGQFVSVFQNRRWDSDFLTVKKLLADGTLSRITDLQLNWHRFRPVLTGGWREQPHEGAGLMWDLGAHMVDQALQLLGKPSWMFADAYASRSGASVNDGFQIIFGYSNSRAVLKASLLNDPQTPRMIVATETGCFTKYGLDVQEAQLKAGGSPKDKAFGLEPEDQYGYLTDLNGDRQKVVSQPGQWLHYYNAVYDALLGEESAPVELSEVRDAIRLLELAHKCLQRDLPAFETEL